jgi:drug/metabolite transporter (DMT)-like permease
VNQRSVFPYLWMLLGSAAFATMGTLASSLKTSCDWQTIAFVRAFLAFVFAAGLAIAAGAQLVLWRPVVLWGRSIAGSISMVCTFYALQHLPISDVFTVTNMFPIWVAILSWPVMGEVPPMSVWVSAACGVVGVGLIQQPHFMEGNFALLIALLASFATAFAMLGLHQLYFLDTRAVVAHFSGVATLFCGASFFLFERTQPVHNVLAGRSLVMLLGVGVMATIGQLCLTKAFTTGAPAKVSVVGLTQIVFAMIYDVVLWQQSFEPIKLVGMALVIAPTAWLLTNRPSEVQKEVEPKEVERKSEETKSEELTSEASNAAPNVARSIPENPP